MRPDWRDQLQQPLTLSLLLHAGLAALLFAFSHHLRPELPEPAAPLQARLYGALPAPSRPAVIPAALPKPDPVPAPVKPALPEKPAPQPKPADKPKAEPAPKSEKPRPDKPAPAKTPPEKTAPLKPSKPEKTVSTPKEAVLPKSRSSEHKQAEKPPAKTADKKPAKDKPEAVRAPDKTPPKERAAPEQPSSSVKRPDKGLEKTKDNAKEKPRDKPSADPKDKPRADDKPKAQDKPVQESKPVRKPEPPKKLQAVSELDELEREMQSVQGQLKAQQERDRLKKAADAAARAEAERLAGEQRAEAQRLAQLQKARDSSALIGKYTQLIRGKITKVWDIPLNISKNSRAVLSISLLPGGEVANVVVVQSSGDKAFDESIKAAVYRASPLPVPEDSATFGQTFKNFRIEFMKED